MKRRLIIGDIHGCYSELLALLDEAGIGDDDEIIAVGDIVDRGPAPAEVLAFFRERPHVTALRGNSEHKHILSARGELAPGRSQKIVREQLGKDYERAVDFMRSFPVYIDMPEAIIIHGLWEPGVPLKSQQEQVLCGTEAGEAYIKESYPEPWYAGYSGDKPLLVGHHDYLKTGKPLRHKSGVWGLDTGCCYGGRLTGLLLPDFKVVSVPAARNYWSPKGRTTTSS